MADDYTMVSGDSKQIQITVLDSDGDAVDLSSATINYAIAEYRGGAAVVSKASGGSGIALGSETNEAIVTLDPADTASLQGRYYHEFQLTEDSDKYTLSLTNGTIYIQADSIT